jgi:protein TonB
MNNIKKTFSHGRTYALSALAVVVAVGANVLMFCILAVARTMPALIDPEPYESVHMITLDLPALASDETAVRDTVMDIIQLNTEATDSEMPQPVEQMASSIFPRLAERLQNVSFELPGLPVKPSHMTLLKPAETASVGGIVKPVSASKVDRFPSKISGPPPRYPRWARRDDLEAVVTLRFIITAEGTVEDINIHRIEGDERFGAEAIRAVRQWRFSPAIRADKPVACWCFQKINFKFTR